MSKFLTARRREARELYDAGMMLLARYGFAKEQHGQHLTEAEIGAFRISVTASRTRRDLHVWYTGGSGATVMIIAGSNANFTVVRFRRGQWEQELLVLSRQDEFLKTPEGIQQHHALTAAYSSSNRQQ